MNDVFFIMENPTPKWAVVEKYIIVNFFWRFFFVKKKCKKVKKRWTNNSESKNPLRRRDFHEIAPPQRAKCVSFRLFLALFDLSKLRFLGYGLRNSSPTPPNFSTKNEPFLDLKNFQPYLGFFGFFRFFHFFYPFFIMHFT